MKALLNRLLLPPGDFFTAKVRLYVLIGAMLTVFNMFLQEASAQETPDPEAPDSTASPEPTPPPRAEINLEKNRQALYAKSLPAEALVTLETPVTAFIGLWEPAKGDTPTGAVLLLHGEGQTPDWPQTIEPLRTYLPERGWSTLSISLPDPHILMAPKRQAPNFQSEAPVDPGENQESTEATPSPSATETATNTPSPSATAPPTSPPTPKPDMELDALNRIAAGFRYLHEKGQFNIVLAGEGLGALRAAEYASIALVGSPDENEAFKAIPADLNQRPIRAIIFINALNEPQAQDKMITQFFEYGDVPVLDIYSRSHHLADLHAKQRRDAARKNKLATYVQIPINLADAEAFEEENLLTRRIRGFMNKHAKGVEIDK